MPWIALAIAGLFEIIWATAMKQSAGFTRLWPSLLTLAAMLASLRLPPGMTNSSLPPPFEMTRLA